MAEAVEVRTAAIPARLNLALLVAAASASSALLWGASHAAYWPVVLACAITFSFTANTLFSLLHEAVHHIFSPHPTLNEWAGRLAAAYFPTGLSVQRAFHFTHHRNNRSESEQFDIVHEGDVGWLKQAQWYSLLTGVYWLVAVLGVVVYLVVPRVLRLRLLRARSSKVAEQTSSNEYLEALEGLDPVKARLEIAAALAFQVSLFLALDLTPLGLISCYATFALSWSALQYADHAFSPLDRHEGAWNLEVGPVTRAFFLNYHYHRAHHQNPTVPWSRLPAMVDKAEPMPSYWRIWLEMWKGPRPAGAEPPLEKLFAPPAGQSALAVELRCLREMASFGWRHPRYWLIAAALLAASLPSWRKRRLLRTGFTFLQLVDDLLDGDRPSAQEPLEVVDAVVVALETKQFEADPLHHLAATFEKDLSQAGGEAAMAKAIALIREMQQDRRRVLAAKVDAFEAALPQDELREHLRRTFELSVDLMLLAAGSKLGAQNVPELIEAFGWCSVMRDLREDLEAGLCNIPREVLRAARQEGLETTDHDEVVESQVVQRWMAEELARAQGMLEITENKLVSLEGQPGAKILRLFATSISKFAKRRLLRRYPGIRRPITSP